MFNELVKFQELSSNIDLPVWKAQSYELSDDGDNDDKPIEMLTQHLLTILNICESSTGPSYKLSSDDLEVSTFYDKKANANRLLKEILVPYVLCELVWHLSAKIYEFVSLI